MSSISINGVTIRGNNICISNGKITVDGKNVTPDSKTINIAVDGNINVLEVDCCDKVIVNGSSNSVQTVSGDIECSDVDGPVSTVSGDIVCGKVGGKITTVSGDVMHRR